MCVCLRVVVCLYCSLLFVFVRVVFVVVCCFVLFVFVHVLCIWGGWGQWFSYLFVSVCHVACAGLCLLVVFIVVFCCCCCDSLPLQFGLSCHLSYVCFCVCASFFV